jgi:hypothetical protein
VPSPPVARQPEASNVTKCISASKQAQLAPHTLQKLQITKTEI